MHFTYDSLGPASVTYNGVKYFYLKNAQGDVTGLVNASGTMASTTGELYEHLAAMEKSSSQILVSCCSVRYHADKNKQSFCAAAYFLYIHAQVPNRRLRFLLFSTA